MAALVLSVLNLVILQKDARLDVALPAILRIGGDPDYTLVWLQPTLSTTQNSDRVKMASTLKLTLHRQSAGGAEESPQFIWDESGKWEYDPPTGGLAYVPAADPAPMVVHRDTPKSPVARFIAKRWSFSPGRYEGRLEVHRPEGGKPLMANFCLYLSDGDVQTLQDPANRTRLYMFRNDDPTTRSQHGDCYVGFSHSAPAREKSEGVTP
ncbi:hypothetical protein [Streptomyces boluensis]|uniref:Uncharacterized protein n=1 Tax=Streptomyces boluensis TaxID=1775135 RepID=A0A964UJL3_9ACTN|nr:hypothetical protein [Streptomyces boluensis]NBE50369.1 hypothetical protein [Streptomyces boluensis]